MRDLLRLIVFLVGSAATGMAVACSWVPMSVDQALFAKAIAIGKVVDEQVVDSMPGGEFRRSRSVTVALVENLRGSIQFPVRSGISCGSSYAPVGSRVVVVLVEPGLYGVVEATDTFERELRVKVKSAR